MGRTLRHCKNDIAVQRCTIQRSGCDGSVLWNANGVDSQAARRRGHNLQKDELVRTIGHGGRLLASNDMRRPVAEVDGCQNGRRDRPRAWKEPSVRKDVRAQHIAHRARSLSQLRVYLESMPGRAPAQEGSRD
jgi:hypothetical protein